MRTVLKLNLLCILAVTRLAAEDAAPVAADPVAVQAQIEALAHEHYERREQAYRQLLELGEGLWPRLEPELQGRDLERVMRVKALAWDFAVLLPDQMALAADCREQLCEADGNTRSKGLEGLLRLGPGGVRALKFSLGGAAAYPELTLTTHATVLLTGRTAKIEASLRNSGVQPFWIREKSNPLQTNTARLMPFGAERPVDWFNTRTGGGRRILRVRGGYYNPIRDWQPILCGAGLQADLSCEFTAPGYRDFSVQAELECGTIKPRLPDSETTADCELNQALPEARRCQQRELRIFALPDPEQQRGTARATLHVKITGVADGIQLEAEVRSELPGRLLRLEADLAKYAWCALVRERDDMPIAWGSWLEARDAAAEPPDAVAQFTDERLLEPGAAAKWKLGLPLPLHAGRYRVIVGYEVACEEFNVLAYEPQPVPPRVFDTDQLLNLNEARLTARTPAFELHIPGEVK